MPLSSNHLFSVTRILSSRSTAISRSDRLARRLGELQSEESRDQRLPSLFRA